MKFTNEYYPNTYYSAGVCSRAIYTRQFSYPKACLAGLEHLIHSEVYRVPRSMNSGLEME